MQRRHFSYSFIRALLGASLLLLGSWLPVIGQVPVAAASSFVIGSDPIDGSTILKPPAIVRIYFDAPLSVLSQASVYAFTSSGPASGQMVNSGQSYVNPANDRELDTPLVATNKLPQGSYEVRWTAVSLTDGRTTSGLIGFNLGVSITGAAGTPTLGPSTSNTFPQLDLQGALGVAWEWLVLLALLFWIGILLTDIFILPRSIPSAVRQQERQHARSLQLFCLLAALVGEMINLFLRVTAFTQSLNGSGVDLSALLQVLMHTSYGYLWLARVLLLGIAISILLWQRRRQQRAEGTVALRKALRLDHLPEIAVSPQAARFQARVTGAVVASSTSTTRNTTVALPRSNSGELSETALPPSPSRIPFGWLVLAGLLLLTLVLSNEIVQLTTLPLSAGIFLWLSLVAQAVWLGTLAYLGITFLPVLPVLEPDHHVEILITVLKRSLPFLCSAVGVLLVSELFLSEATLQTPAQLLETPYGMALLIRGILLLLACLLTGWLLCFLLPGLQRQAVLLPVVQADLPARRARKFALEKTVGTIRGVLRVVAALTAGSLLCVALMDFFAPPVVFPAINYAALVNSQVASSGSSSAGASLQTLQTQQAGGLSATLQTLPAHVGMTNTVIVTLSDAQGQPVSNASITLHITMQTMDMGETSSMLQNRSNGVYIAVLQDGQTLSMAGPWTFQAVIAWPGHTSVQMVFHITMTT